MHGFTAARLPLARPFCPRLSGEGRNPEKGWLDPGADHGVSDLRRDDTRRSSTSTSTCSKSATLPPAVGRVEKMPGSRRGLLTIPGGIIKIGVLTRLIRDADVTEDEFAKAL